jgi:hypothetical protein
MKRIRFSPILILLIMAPALSGAQTLPSAYEALASLFGVDLNAGLTRMLITRIPMGGLAEGMGMAYTAVASDSSFLELNPSASSLQDYTELSVYHNNWIADTRVESAVYTMRFGDVGFAVGGKWLYLPFTEYDDYGDRASSGYYSEALLIGNASIHLFPGYYFYGLAVGANLKLAYQSFPDYAGEDDVVQTGSGASQSALAVMADLGLMTKFNFLKYYASRKKNVSVGLALKNLGPPVQGDPLPTVATVGLAYSPIRPVTVSSDFSVPVNLVDFSKSEDPYWSVGTLVTVTDFFAMQGGLQIKGGNPRLSVGSSIDFNPMTILVNYTLDLTTQFSSLNRLSIQARFRLGDMGRAAKAAKVDALYVAGLESYARGDVERAISYWTEVLVLDPSFDPARDALRAAKDFQGLHQDVLDRRIE